jgi:hypothetical protein
MDKLVTNLPILLTVLVGEFKFLQLVCYKGLCSCVVQVIRATEYTRHGEMNFFAEGFVQWSLRHLISMDFGEIST